MEITEGAIEHWRSGSFVGRLKNDMLRWIFAGGMLQFQYHEGMVFATDRGCILSRQDFEEIVNHWRLFYDRFSDEEIKYINEHKHEYRRQAHHAEPETKALKKKAGCVYILKGEGYYKIGKTTNLKQRMWQVTPRLPFETELIHTIKTDDIDQLEESLHKRFATKRVNGEWFELEENDIAWITQIDKVVGHARLKEETQEGSD